LISSIFKQKKSRENSNPPDEKDDKKKTKKKKRERKESPKKKKRKRGRGRSDSSSSSDGRPSSLTSPSPPPVRPNSGASDNSSKVLDRPDSSTSVARVPSPIHSPSPSQSPDLNHHHSVSSPSPELSRSVANRRDSISPPQITPSPAAKKRSISRSPAYNSRSSVSRSPSPVVKTEPRPISAMLATPLSPMLSPMSGGESGAERGRKTSRARKERDKSSKKQKLKSEPKKDTLNIKEEPIEFPDSKTSSAVPRASPVQHRTNYQDESSTSVRTRRPSFEDKTSSPVVQQPYSSSKPRKESSRSISEEDGGSDNNGTPGSIEPYCQDHHLPHPSIEELRDTQYLARLQAINMAINSPCTAVALLNSVVELILETGNFSTDQEHFQFDICNLDQGTISKIETILELP